MTAVRVPSIFSRQSKTVVGGACGPTGGAGGGAAEASLCRFCSLWPRQARVSFAAGERSMRELGPVDCTTHPVNVGGALCSVGG